MEIMKKRRAQFFAPAIKALDLPRDKHVREFEDYVDRKYKLKVD